MTPRQTSVRTVFRGPGRIVPLTLLLVAGGVGCYRATGQTRPTTVAQQIPATGGDRVTGMKATSGPGDYYLGSDYVQMAVDGAPYGQVKGQFGAASGGGILDIGGVTLDTAYKRVSMPTDNLDRLGPVVNQDPDLPLVFDHYATDNTTDLVTLSMTGYLLDPLHKLSGASWASDGRVIGVTVAHSISLGPHDTYFTLTTTLTNSGAAALPVQSIGDYLQQRGGGFRFIIPANQDASGAPLSSWGVDIPGSDFTQPLATSARAPMAAMAGAETSADDFDSHQSLGILPLTVNQASADQVMVASDPQVSLSEDRPVFPSRLVVGSVPGATALNPGQTLSYARRLYTLSGRSLTPGYPVGSEGISNVMEAARAQLRGVATPASATALANWTGLVTAITSGTAAYGGYRQTEIRFERYTGADGNAAATDTNQANWTLERLMFPESGENTAPGLSATLNLPAYPDPANAGKYMPYRVVVRNKDTQSVRQVFDLVTLNGVVPTSTFGTLLRPALGTSATIQTSLSAEMDAYQGPDGHFISPSVFQYLFSGRDVTATPLSTPPYRPGRVTLQGLNASGAPDSTLDPNARRVHTMEGIYNPLLKAKSVLSVTPGDYRFGGGNSLFTAHLGYTFGFPVTRGSYLAMASHGPLDPVTTLGFSAPSYGSPVLSLPFRDTALPSGWPWTTFDVPGPSQRSTGGMIPAEQLTSALAEGVDIVGRTETDRLIDGTALYNSYRSEFSLSGDAATDAAHLAKIGAHPFVVSSRSSSLAEGAFTTLFTAAPDANLPFGGALPSEGWSAADFIGQGGGAYVIAHRPRGPQGLFTSHPVAAGVALGSGANGWWLNTDALANGHRLGEFQAIELLRGESCNPADPSAWFAEFKNVRTDWFNLLNLQSPASFTKALGLSSGVYSQDTPVGLARTYLNLGAATPSQGDLSAVQAALQRGAAVASTGPLLDVSAGGQGPGGFVSGTNANVTLTANLWFGTWVPVDEIRVVVNGAVAQTLHLSDFTQDTTDARHWSASISVPMSTLTGGKDGWIVVEAGVPLTTTGAYAPNTPWNEIMKGIYPVAVTNPIFVDVNGGGYTPPLP